MLGKKICFSNGFLTHTVAYPFRISVARYNRGFHGHSVPLSEKGTVWEKWCLRTVVFHQRSELVSGFREFKDNNPGNDASLNLKVWGRATALGHSHHRWSKGTNQGMLSFQRVRCNRKIVIIAQQSGRFVPSALLLCRSIWKSNFQSAFHWSTTFSQNSIFCWAIHVLHIGIGSERRKCVFGKVSSVPWKTGFHCLISPAGTLSIWPVRGSRA